MKRKNYIFLSALSGVSGIIVTSILTAKSTIKAVRIYDDMKKTEKCYKKNVIKNTWKCYIPPILTGAIFSAASISFGIKSKNYQASLTSAYIFLQESYKKYREKISDELGEEKEKEIHLESDIESEINVKKVGKKLETSENILFYEEHYSEFFERRMIEVLDAEYQLNKKFALEGYATINDFFRFLGLNEIKEGDVIGWSIDDGYDFYNWIEFEHRMITVEDGMECYVIETVFNPSVLNN